MQLTKIALKISLILASLALLLAWLIGTNSGLDVALRVAARFSPYSFSYQKVQGKLIGEPITLTGLTVEYNHQIVQIAALSVDWQQRNFNATRVQGFEAFLPQAILATGQATVIEHIQGHIDLLSGQQRLQLALHGQWQQAPLHAKLLAMHQQDQWQLQFIEATVGNNALSVKASTNLNYVWSLDLPQPQIILKDGYGHLHAKGNLNLNHDILQLQLRAHTRNFGFQNYAIRDLEITANNVDPANIKLSATAAKLLLDGNNVSDVKIDINGTPEQHHIHASLKYQTYPFTLDTVGMLRKDIWRSNALTITQQLADLTHKLHGNAVFNLRDQLGELTLKGKLFDASTELTIANKSKNHFYCNLAMMLNPKNHLKAELNLKSDSILGSINVEAEDLSIVMKMIPDLTRLKGKLKAHARISGTLKKPSVKVKGDLTDITATFPHLGVKIKPMELHATADESGKVIFTGYGKMRRGPGEFTLKGYVEPLKPNMPNELQIIGTGVEFINNEHAQLIASNDLKFFYDQQNNRMDITGYIEIQKGNIYVKKGASNTVKSKDVVFLNEKSEPKSSLNFNPHINLRILEEVRFTGFDLDANISGKLDIVRRNDAIYAEGRVTIKEGTYALPGQKMQIHKGRLLFPPGTLLANPSLDIKLQSAKKDDLEVAVQGTAQKPIIRETGLAGNPEKIISQAFSAGTDMLNKKFTNSKIKMPDIGIEGRHGHEPNFFDDPSKRDQSALANKDLVIGLPLGKKLHLQYLQGLTQMNNAIENQNRRVRLKYKLHENWDIGVETGEQGAGADLSFTIERD